MTQILRMTPAHLAAEDRGSDNFALALGVTPGFPWPPEHHDADTRAYLRDLLDVPAKDAAFVAYYILSDDQPVGTCGFKGPPDAQGRVEIGYSVVSARQRQGHASAAIRQLLAMAFADPRVTEVVAETLPHLVASQRTAKRCGFELATRKPDPENGEILFYRCLRT